MRYEDYEINDIVLLLQNRRNTLSLGKIVDKVHWKNGEISYLIKTGVDTCVVHSKIEKYPAVYILEKITEKSVIDRVNDVVSLQEGDEIYFHGKTFSLRRREWVPVDEKNNDRYRVR